MRGLAVFLAGCTAASPYVQAGRCAAGLGAPVSVYELFFGRSVPGGGEVSDSTWNVFEAQVVTPNLLDGYTVFDADGAWMNPATRHTIHERTKLLLVALPEGDAGSGAIGRIRRAYEMEFHQTLVGMTVTASCGSF